MKGTITLLTVVAVMLAASIVEARNTPHELPVQDAVTHAIAGSKLLKVPYYFAGQKHPTVKQDLGVYTSNRKTRGLLRSDVDSCRVAFLSALIALQERAQVLGGDAVVDITSITKDVPFSSPDEYRCVAGAVIVHVALTGRMVKFAGSR